MPLGDGKERSEPLSKVRLSRNQSWHDRANGKSLVYTSDSCTACCAIKRRTPSFILRLGLGFVGILNPKHTSTVGHVCPPQLFSVFKSTPAPLNTTILFPEWLAKLFSGQNSCFVHQRTRVVNRIPVWHADANACGSWAALQARHVTHSAAAHLWFRDYEFSMQQFLDNLYLKLKLFLWWSVFRRTKSTWYEAHLGPKRKIAVNFTFPTADMHF